MRRYIIPCHTKPLSFNGSNICIAYLIQAPTWYQSPKRQIYHQIFLLSTYLILPSQPLNPSQWIHLRPAPPSPPKKTPRHTHNPCLNQSVNLAFPSWARLFTPCSLKSTFNWGISCAGALLTLCTMIVGSVSNIIPSSTISSMARERRS